MQANNRDVQGQPQGLTLGKEAGRGVCGVEKEVYHGTDFIAFLPREKNGH